MTEPRGGSQRGFTLLETIIVFTVLMSVVSIMANLITTTTSTQKYTERMARCTEVNQEIINDVRGELLSAVTLFESGPLGDGYFAALTPDPTSPPLATSSQATLIPNDTFQKETGAVGQVPPALRQDRRFAEGRGRRGHTKTRLLRFSTPEPGSRLDQTRPGTGQSTAQNSQTDPSEVGS